METISTASLARSALSTLYCRRESLSPSWRTMSSIAPGPKPPISSGGGGGGPDPGSNLPESGGGPGPGPEPRPRGPSSGNAVDQSLSSQAAGRYSARSFLMIS